MQEIYSLPLAAQLVVLSACQTGTGTTQQGEGVMSLARAFQYQGTPSVIASLWNVDDKSTSNIMTQFYQNLRTGKSKTEALRLAKLQHLENASAKEAHPFYWSPFILVGEGEALNTSSIFDYWWLLVLVAVLLLGIAWRNRIG